MLKKILSFKRYSSDTKFIKLTRFPVSQTISMACMFHKLLDSTGMKMSMLLKFLQLMLLDVAALLAAAPAFNNVTTERRCHELAYHLGLLYTNGVMVVMWRHVVSFC